MTAPNYPNNPTIGDTHLVGTITFQWDGEKWKSVTPGNHEARLASIEQGNQLINDLSQAYEFTVILDAIQFTGAIVNKITHINEITLGDGGGGVWKYITAGTTPDVDLPDGDSIRQCTGVPTLALFRVQSGTVRGELNKSYGGVAGVIRNSGSGWFIIDDALHTNMSIRSVSATSNIQVNYRKTFEKITSLIAAPDETLVKKGVMVGASVGNGNSLIDLTAPISFNVNAATGTLTIDALFTPYIETIATDAHQLVINHPNMVGAPTITGAGGAGRIRGKVSYGATQTIITEVCDISGYVQWNGVAWQYFGDMFVEPTMAFEAGVLTITHSNAFDTMMQVTGRGTSIPAAGSVGLGTTPVIFYDFAGAQIMTEATSMRVHFRRNGEAQAKTVGGLYAVQLGVCELAADEFVSASGNIWLHGVFEDNSS